jgi:hypothetical protein
VFTERNEAPAEFGEGFIVHQTKARTEDSQHRRAWRIHRAVVSACIHGRDTGEQGRVGALPC